MQREGEGVPGKPLLVIQKRFSRTLSEKKFVAEVKSIDFSSAKGVGVASPRSFGLDGKFLGKSENLSFSEKRKVFATCRFLKWLLFT
ncbi:MAG: hypothetical protein A2007_02145 [Verrucomicrobia bacterium GWC2_42_7]|nr:MAG: hypothetical protein A2007_02145 [Verrucomicrobia bacterium GWC2_42_7]